MKIRIYIGLLTLIIVMSILSNINWANIPSVTYAANKLGNVFACNNCTCSYNSISCNGLTFPKNDISGVTNSLKLMIEYEPWFKEECRLYATPTKAAIDIGAHIGYHTRTMAETFKHVYAFEPNKDIFPFLSRNMNGYNNVTCLPYGVGDKSGTFSFNSHNISARSHLDNEPCLKSRDVGCVEALVLDDVNHIFSFPIGFIKIDIEGGEILAIKGMVKLIKRDKPVIVFEDHNGSTIAFIQATLPEYYIEKIDASNFKAIHKTS